MYRCYRYTYYGELHKQQQIFHQTMCCIQPVSFVQTGTGSTHLGPLCLSAPSPPLLIWSSPTGKYQERRRTQRWHICKQQVGSQDRRHNDEQPSHTKMSALLYKTKYTWYLFNNNKTIWLTDSFEICVTLLCLALYLQTSILIINLGK